MDFAQKQLEKYGWKEGSGLGKEENGISVALKPQYKSGKEGLGFKLSEELTSEWWTKVCDDSLKRIAFKEDGDRLIADSTNVEDDLDDKNSALVNKMKKKIARANFREFSKGAVLDGGELKETEKLPEDLLSEQKTATKRKPVFSIKDDSLLKACEGRTAHKGARFGLKLNGKLARIAEQEALLLQSLTNKTQNPLGSVSSNRSKSPTQSIKNFTEEMDEPKKKKKKKHKKRSRDFDSDTEEKSSKSSKKISEHCIKIFSDSLTNVDEEQKNLDDSSDLVLDDIPGQKKRKKKSSKRKIDKDTTL